MTSAPLSDLPELRGNDLLVLTTRPPLTDREAVHKPRRIILSSQNDLEKLIFKQLFHHISYLYPQAHPPGRRAPGTV